MKTAEDDRRGLARSLGVFKSSQQLQVNVLEYLSSLQVISIKFGIILLLEVG